MMVLAWAGR
jgi:hypothetical protein